MLLNKNVHKYQEIYLCNSIFNLTLSMTFLSKMQCKTSFKKKKKKKQFKKRVTHDP